MSMWMLMTDVVPLAVATVLALIFAALPAGRRRVSRLRLHRGQPTSTSVTSGMLGFAASALAFSAGIRWLLGTVIDRGDPFSYRWWSYATELIVALGAVAVVLVVVAGLRPRPQAPVPPSTPRTWRTYLSGSQLRLPGAALGALLLLVIFAGSVSSTDGDGIYRLLVIDTGSELGGASAFFGWAYGLPVAGCSVLLAVMTIVALHVTAANPFLRPDTVGDEERSRSALSARLVWLCSGTLLLSLSRALVSVAGGAALELQGPEHEWTTEIAALSPWLYGTGAVLLLWAYALLLLVAATSLPIWSPRAAASGTRIESERTDGVLHG